jgi:acetyltransferase-like isoleucine patch superfamily enzyme
MTGMVSSVDIHFIDKLTIASYTSIARNVCMQGRQGHGLPFGFVTTFIFNHAPLSCDLKTPYPGNDIKIGNDVWIGTRVIILSGVTIGDGAIIGAGAVVTHDVEPYSIVAGNPARHIRYRFPESVRQALLEIRWWDWPLSELQKVRHLLFSERIEDFLRYAKQIHEESVLHP